MKIKTADEVLRWLRIQVSEKMDGEKYDRIIYEMEMGLNAMHQDIALAKKRAREAVADRDMVVQDHAMVRVKADPTLMFLNYGGTMSYTMLSQALDVQGICEATGQKMAIDMMAEWQKAKP